MYTNTKFKIVINADALYDNIVLNLDSSLLF